MDKQLKIVSQRLNDLLVLLRVSESGFELAGKLTSLLDHVVYFDRKMYVYTEFISELEGELVFLEIYNEEVNKCPHFFKKKWNSFKWYFSNCTDQQKLSNSVEAEKELIAAYQSALKLELKSSTKILLDMQLEYIQLNLLNYKTLLN